MPQEVQRKIHVTPWLRDEATKMRSAGRGKYADALLNITSLVPENAAIFQHQSSSVLYTIFKMTEVEYDSAEWWMAIAQAAALLNSISVATHF